MKKLNSRETFILIIALTLSISFMAFQFVIKPMHEGSLDVNDQLRVVKNKLIKAQQMVAQKNLVERRYQHLVNLIRVVDSQGAQMPTIIAKIEEAARDSNIHIANIQPRKIIVQKEANFLGVELEIDGQWLDIVQFLYVLQQRPNFYFINELNLEKYSGELSSLRGRIVISRMFLANP